MDDVLVLGQSFKEHQERLESALLALEKNGLTLNVDKCLFARPRVEHLGHVIDHSGIRPHPDKVKASFKIRNIKSFCSFLCLGTFFRRYIPEFLATASPLYGLLKKNAVRS